MYSSNPATHEAMQVPRDLAKLEPNVLDKLAFERGAEFASAVDSTQLRNIYGSIVRIRMAFERREKTLEEIVRLLIFLRPKLAYMAWRLGQKDKRKKKDVRRFADFFKDAISAVVDSGQPEQALRNFFSLAEAVVAYHKFHSTYRD